MGFNPKMNLDENLPLKISSTVRFCCCPKAGIITASSRDKVNSLRIVTGNVQGVKYNYPC